MDLNLLRSLFTAVMFAVFIGIVLWAWSARRHADFEAAAQLPLDDDRAAGEGRVR
jgi:cytochrome c oxidase cbb3-type subunit 4